MRGQLAFGLMLAAGLVAVAHHVGAAEAPTHVAPLQGGGVLRATLGNGLRVVIVRDTLAPTVTTQMTYLAGGYETPPGFPGTAHALEHMMFRDSKGLTGAQLNEITGKMGGDNNAFTTNDATQFSFAAPAAYLDLALRIEAGRMRGALLSDKDWRLEKGAIEQEVSGDISDPGFLAFEQAENLLYAGTGYAEDPLGTRPSFDRTTPTTLRRFYDAWYRPNNAIYVIVGDVDPQATLAEVKALFGSIPSRPTPSRKPVVLGPVKAQTIARTTPAGTGTVQFLYRMPGLESPDNAAAQVLLDVLNNPRSALSELAAQGKVLSADAGLQPFKRGGIGIVEVGFAKSGDPQRARARLDRVVGALLERGVPSDLVEAAKRSELAQFEFNKNSATSVASAWSQALAWQGLDSPEAAEEQIQRVTAADVDRVARQYLRPNGRITIVLTPDPDGKRPPNSSGFGGSESFAGDDKLDVALPDWAAKALSRLVMPHWTLDPTQMKLENGITLIVQPETVSKTVTVVGHVDHDAGLQEPKGQEGVGRLLASLFDYGTATLDRSAFHKALDAIAASESGGDDFSLAVPSIDFDRGMQLLADNELHPALPEQAFAIQRQILARALAGELESPQYRMLRALRQGLLPAGDPHLREATPATVDALTLNDARGYLADTYRPDLTTIVVVGDVSPAQAKATVTRYFGAWKAHGAKPDVIAPKVPINPPGYTVVPNPYASQDQVLMGQMLDLDLRNPDRYALELGNDVLGGNGFASRLMQDIRVRHGYAYDARSGMQFDRSRSTFYVRYGSDPDRVAATDALVLANIKAMQQTPVNDKELTNARQYQIRSIPLEVASVDRIARSLLTWSYLGEPLDQPMVAAKSYLDLTAQQVQHAFERYLQPQHLVQVVQGPAPGRH
ncbi:MAG: insulinase family protein [Betaproteobacteria bacterium]|nr:insulinase family protein [Betaproteobacteria bacterium]MDE2208278.1 insulinase family protein [Betaproteobacteria bacterium]